MNLRDWECNECRAKAGTPVLCPRCLRVRALVSAADRLCNKRDRTHGWENQGYLSSSVRTAMNDICRALEMADTSIAASVRRDKERSTERGFACSEGCTCVCCDRERVWNAALKNSEPDA